MNKYKIEDGINFFEELYKSLDNEDNNLLEENNKFCLISNELLTSNFVELICGHKFNYIHLYNDIKNHKQKFNNLENNSGRLNNNEIRCPYCRNKHIGVLPYYEELGLTKINGVNYINPNYVPHQHHLKYKKCQYFTPTLNNMNENITSNMQLYLCNSYGLPINCKNGIIQGENYGDEKYYCWSHKQKIISKYKKDIANKLKEEKNQLKLKEKEEKNQLKLKEKEEKSQLKLKEKEEKSQLKLKEKEDKQTKITENKILTIDNNIHCETCNNILKTGPNKGQVCGSKILSDNLCKRHYNLKHHKIKNEII